MKRRSPKSPDLNKKEDAIVKTLTWPILWLGLIAFSGCGVPGSGVSMNESRDVDAFDRISMAGSGDLTIQCGQDHSLELTTDDNLIELIETVVDDGHLKIRPLENIAPTIRPKYAITTDKLSQVSISGSSDVTIAEYQGDELILKIAGSGSFKVAGECEKVNLKIAGSGDVDLLELVAKDVSISIAGSGDAKVIALENLTVKIAGSGDVRYIGAPEIRKSIAGSGDISQISRGAGTAERHEDDQLIPAKTGTAEDES
jgi:hypothetical protein